MRGKDDKVVPDPNRFSTNKRVKALGENIFGTPVLTAEGTRRLKPDAPNETSARFVPAGETPAQRQARKEEEARKAREQPLLEQESFLNEARKNLFKRGSMTQLEREALILTERRMKGERT